MKQENAPDDWPPPEGAFLTRERPGDKRWLKYTLGVIGLALTLLIFWAWRHSDMLMLQLPMGLC